MLAARPDPSPGELDKGGAEQVAARGDRIAPRDVARAIHRLHPDEPIVLLRAHDAWHESQGPHASNGNFESLRGQ